MPALSSAAPRPYSRPVPLGRLERVAVPGRGVAGRLHVVVRVQQDRGGAGRPGPVPEHGGLAAPGGDAPRPRAAPAARSSAATSRALAARCGAAAGSADTDGIRTSRSRSARTDGSTPHRRREPLLLGLPRARSCPWAITRTLPASPGRPGAPALGMRPGSARVQVQSPRRTAPSSRWSCQLRVADDDHPVGDGDGPPVPPGRPDGQQVERRHVLAVLGQQVVQALVAGDPAGALGALEDDARRCSAARPAARSAPA